jgi:phosphodiesterase/alkaline phosphatase D-like protein
MWKRYVGGRELYEIYRTKKLIPIIAVWDDHDFGGNDTDSSFPLKKESTQIFQSMFAQSANQVDYIQGPGVSSAAQLLGLQIILLDDRSFRTKNNEFGPIQEHFGKAQEEWLNLQLKRSKLPSLIISGDQFFGSYHQFESYEKNHPKAFQNFLKSMKKVNKAFVFVSGDRHLTEIMKIPHKEVGQNTFELTSSGIHSRTYPSGWDKFPNKRQLVGADLSLNYMLIDVQNFYPFEFSAISKGPQNKILFSEKLKVGR